MLWIGRSLRAGDIIRPPRHINHSHILAIKQPVLDSLLHGDAGAHGDLEIGRLVVVVEVDDGMHGAVDAPDHMSRGDYGVQVRVIFRPAVCLDRIDFLLVATVQ